MTNIPKHFRFPEQTEKLLLDGKAREYEKDLENIKTAIQLKFTLNDRLNKQLSQLIEAAGGKENDPLHMKVKYSANFFPHAQNHFSTRYQNCV